MLNICLNCSSNKPLNMSDGARNFYPLGQDILGLFHEATKKILSLKIFLKKD